jgi:Anti-sigma factor NepR
MSDGSKRDQKKASPESGNPVKMNKTDTLSGDKQDKKDWIGANLKRVYDEALNEPVPDRLLELLKEIEKKDSKPS